jgi:hypothetical protein
MSTMGGSRSHAVSSIFWRQGRSGALTRSALSHAGVGPLPIVVSSTSLLRIAAGGQGTPTPAHRRVAAYP